VTEDHRPGYRVDGWSSDQQPLRPRAWRCRDLLEAIVRGQSVVSGLTAGRRAVSPVAADEVRA